MSKSVSKPIEFSSLCPCGEKFNGNLGKTPTRFKDTFEKFKCPSCGSQFLAITKKRSAAKDKFHIDFKILYLSEDAKNKIKARLKHAT